MTELFRQVEGCGPARSEIMLIGEAPGATEVKEGVPFAGWSGDFLRDMVAQSGLLWTQLRVDNVVQERPPNNSFYTLYDKVINRSGKIVPNRNFPSAKLLAWHKDLKERIINCAPKVVVAIGDEALFALTGHVGVKAWRGSVIEGELEYLPDTLIIPIVHPSFSRRCFDSTSSKQKDIRQPWFNLSVLDLKKARRILREGWSRDERTEKIFPTYHEVMEYLTFLKELPHDHFLIFDIETLYRKHVGCIGITHTRDYAMCIPFVSTRSGKEYWSQHEEFEILKAIDEVFSTHLIGNQTVDFDLAYMWKDFGMVVDKSVFIDPAVLHSLLYPELKHDLGFMTSLYTDMPYFKYLGRLAEAKQDISQWFTYNCYDCQATYEVCEKLIAEAKAQGMWEYYTTRKVPLLQWIIKQHRRGLPVDLTRQEEIRQYVWRDEILPREQALQEALLESGYEKVSLSPKLKEIYDEFAPGENYPTIALNIRSPQQVVEFLQSCGFPIEDSQEETLVQYSVDSILVHTILELRQLYSLLVNVSRPADFDGVFRTSYKLHVAETSRLNSTKSHWQTGSNLQNITKRARPIIAAPPGYVLMEFDLSQAEARAVAYYCGDEGLKSGFLQDVDIHCQRAAMIFQEPYERFYSEYLNGNPHYKHLRQLGKIIVHSVNYDASARSVNTTLKKGGVYMKEKEVKDIIDKVHLAFPGIRLYQYGVQKQLRETNTLTTARGLRRYFYSKLDANTFRRAYAFLPQATVAEITNDSIATIVDELEEYGIWILSQTHDSIKELIPIGQEDKAIAVTKPAMESPTLIYPFIGEPDTLIIPVECKVGTHWGELREIKI